MHDIYHTCVSSPTEIKIERCRGDIHLIEGVSILEVHAFYRFIEVFFLNVQLENISFIYEDVTLAGVVT